MEIIEYFPEIKFAPNGFFAYSSADNLINYDPEQIEDSLGKLDLLHEIGHYLLGHIDYDHDIELLIMEVDAWAKAIELAKKFKIKIDNDYINQCINTYNDWVDARATCPNCDNFSLQESENSYQCFVCQTKWQVNSRKDKRVTRKIIN